MPKFFGVGLPILMAATMAIVRLMGRHRFYIYLFALLAGSMEDALCGLPFAMSTSYFILVAVALATITPPFVCDLFFFIGYQVWLWIWLPELQGSIGVRLGLSFVIALVVVPLVHLATLGLVRKAVVDEV